MADNILWLEEQRDRHAKLRAEAYARDDWETGNPHDDMCKRYADVITELRQARERLEVFTEVLQKRIVIAAHEAREARGHN